MMQNFTLVVARLQTGLKAGSTLLLIFACALTAAAQLKTKAATSTSPGAKLITMQSASPLYEVQIQVRSGSADDPAGKEGTARMTARMLIEGGFGDPKNPVTKEKLAEITRPWGSGALPTVLVDKETTTFSMTVPRDVFPQFVNTVLKPMLTQPLWLAPELDRLRRETLTDIQSRLRFEQQELLGLLALDNYVLGDVRAELGHLTAGTVRSVQALTRDDLQKFYAAHYGPAKVSIAASITEPAALALLRSAVPTGKAQANSASTAKPKSFTGRHMIMITQPNAIATGMHMGFPITLKRGDADYWALFVGNVALGTHRDDFGRLYQQIRQERGYNYGDYSYIEYLYGRPFYLFPPPATPRQEQYFSVWIRPVGHQYAHFILKAAMSELERFVKNGLTPDEVAAAKIKARTLYLNYAESKARQLGYRLDDAFYGTDNNGYLQTMLKSIDAVTPEQVNTAIKKHLQTANMKYVIVTNQSEAEKLANDIANNTNVRNKTNEEYHLTEPIPADKQKMLEQDKEWAAYPLNIARQNITIVKAEQMFETAEKGGKAAGQQ